MISYLAKNSIRILIAILSVVLPLATNAQIVVNGVNGSTITCPNNGSISVSATTSNPPLLYSIIAGPVTQPVQTTTVFNSLPPGNYTIRITDGAGNQTTANTTIAGTYQNPTFTITPTRPYCVGNSDGQLVGNINPGTGTPPFLWQLVTPSPVTTPPQSSNTFTGLPGGNYSMRVTDACGSFSSNAIVLQQPSTEFGFVSFNIGQQGAFSGFQKIGCDSMLVTYMLNIPTPRMPLTFKYNTVNGVYIPSSGTTIDTSFMHTNGQVIVWQVIPNTDYGQPIQATIYNTCGDSAQSMSMTPHPFVFYPRYTFNNCGNTAQVAFANTPYQDFHTSVNAPVTYTFTDAANNVLESATVTVDQNNGLFGMGSTLTTGNTYHFSITDGCGDTFQSNIVVPGLAPPVIIHEDIISAACIDSVVGTYRILTAGFQINARLVLLSGPATLGSTKPRFEYADIYTYPDTVPMINGESFLMNNVAIGTYHYKIIDDCGNEILGSFTITADQVTSLEATHSVEKGCPGRNKIFFGMVSGGKVTIRDIPGNTVLTEKEFWAYPNAQAQQNNHDSLINLFAGSYEITYTFLQSVGSLENGTQINESDIPCWLLVDTVHIAPYHVPEMFTGNAIMCNNTINFVLIPDTSKGLAPYEYEIIAGPQTFPVQNSNIFTITLPGTYTARIYDACGNASIKQITVDTIAFDPIQAITTCNNAVFAFPPSIYFTYQWLMPNGQIHLGDSLILSPVTPADTGMYDISKVININGCSDTLYTSYHVSLGIQVQDTVRFCPGSTVTIGTHTYNLPGIYTDTLTSAQGCDSIITNHLIHIPQAIDTVQVNICQGDSIQLAGTYQHVAGFYTDSVQNTSGCYDLTITDLTVHQSTDTVTASICNGDSYSFGSGSYQVPGFYQDTLVSALGCDSILVLSLSLHTYVEHAISQDICAGEYYLFGLDTLTQTGVYADTLSTASCDSIVTLTLTVMPYKQQAISEIVCPGETFLFGGISLQQSGTYTDTVSTATCDSVITLTLTALPYKTGSVNQTICASETYAFGGQPLNQTGTYTDTLGTATCDSIVTLTLTVLPYKFHAYADTICEGESVAIGGNLYTLPGTYNDTLATGTCDSIVTLILTVIPLKYGNLQANICGYEKYLFNGIYYSQAGVYTHHFPTAACDSIVTLTLTALPAPTVSIGASAYETMTGAVVHLQANADTHPLTYQWTSNASLNHTTIANPTATIQGPTWVYLTVTDSNGCTATAEYQMTVPVTSTLYIPNTYTPNGDYSNGIFRVYGTNIKEFEMMVFNRWGELIFQSSDMDFGWNGTYQGESVQNGMYVYKVVAKGLDNAIHDQIGHITVLR